MVRVDELIGFDTILISSFAGLDNSQLERKIRLLTLTTLGFQNIGRDVPYSVIASTLQVEPSQVESWVIDGSSLHYPFAIERTRS